MTQPHPEPQPMGEAPRDGTMLRLWVRYPEGGSWTPLDDARESWTVGFNNRDNTGDDRWQVVGWCWSHDHLIEASDDVEVLGWLPFHGERPLPATGAEAVVRGDQILISIDIGALPLILSGSIALNAVAGTFKVSDPAIFAEEVCRALNAESENGTTRVHMMFDGAFNHAIGQGAEGVEEISEDAFEAEADRLQAEALSALKAEAR